MANYTFKCIEHQTIADPPESLEDPAKFQCSPGKHEAEIPIEVLKKIPNISTENALINKLMPDSHGTALLKSVWCDMPDDFPFTLIIEA